MHTGGGADKDSGVSRKNSVERDQVIQELAPNTTAMMRSADMNDSANCSTSASGRSDAVSGVGSGTGMLLRRRGKKKKDYPTAWGKPADNMTLKKRVLRVYDGPNQLLKEDVMFNTAYEVRMQLGNGKSHVTALDVETVNRAEFVHQHMTGINGVKAEAEAGYGSTALMEFGINDADVMKGKKRLLNI